MKPVARGLAVFGLICACTFLGLCIALKRGNEQRLLINCANISKGAAILYRIERENGDVSLVEFLRRPEFKSLHASPMQTNVAVGQMNFITEFVVAPPALKSVGTFYVTTNLAVILVRCDGSSEILRKAEDNSETK